MTQPATTILLSSSFVASLGLGLVSAYSQDGANKDGADGDGANEDEANRGRGNQDRSNQEGANQGGATGYGKLALSMTSDPDLAIFRRFSALNVQNLL